MLGKKPSAKWEKYINPWRLNFITNGKKSTGENKFDDFLLTLASLLFSKYNRNSKT